MGAGGRLVVVENSPSEIGLRPLLLASGVTDDELRQLRASESLTTLRPGAYLPADDPRLEDVFARHVLLVRATVRKVAPDAVASHASAAVLHGLPLWRTALDRVHVTKDRRSGGRRTSLLHVHVAALDGDEIVEVDGVAVTSVARTVADLARSESFEQALVPADAALHRHLVVPDDLTDAVGRGAHRSGTPRARRVIAFADAGSMSPGETLSRLAIHRAGLPPPVLQYEIPGTGAEVDFWWPMFRTAGEFDGLAKYGRLLAPEQTAADAVVAEKIREDRVRDEQVGVVRWTWDELPPRFAPVVARIRASFDRA
ncbi:MAG: hypothetical protein JWR81_5337 [Pseudonocardia sp.]|nr:hypothetical protein [Pseudonocardia sp.]